MRNCRYLVAIVAVCSWIGVVSMPVPLWSLSSVKYMLAHTDQSTRPLTDQSHSAMFDKSAYLQQVEESRVRGHVINRAINTIVYDPIPLEDGDYSENFLSQSEVESQHELRKRQARERERMYNRGVRNNGNTERFEGSDDREGSSGNIAYGGENSRRDNRWSLQGLTHLIPQVNFRCDPLINFKLKQRLVVLGACVTLGLDYLSDIAQWRSYCAIEDNLVQGRFSLRGSELGWAKSWLLNLGLGEEQKAKVKLRLGLNLKNYKAYAKLRFRTEPLSPFDIGEGLSCAGKLPLPVPLLPLLRNIPLRVEYRLRVHAGSNSAYHSNSNYGDADLNTEEGRNRDGVRIRRRHDSEKKVQVSSSLGTLDLSLDELNFCLEWDEKSPVWGVGLVRSAPVRKGISTFQSMRDRYTSTRDAVLSSVIGGSGGSGNGIKGDGSLANKRLGRQSSDALSGGSFY